MTNQAETAPTLPRSIYEEGCLAAHALDFLGDRWSFLVVRELAFGPKRFSLLRAGLPGISASVLTKRLEGLEATGILRRTTLPEPADIQVYELTTAGHGVFPILQALCVWGVKMPGHDPGKFISPSALMISMTAMIDRDAARDLRVRAGFDMGRERFCGELVDGQWQVRRGPATGDIILTGTGNALAPVIYGPAPLTHWTTSNQVQVRGDLTLGQQFIDLFELRRS